jgi:hypothetical protein
MNQPRQVSGQYISFLIIFLLMLYAVNCFTPLRLTFDTIRYFKIKEWIEAGRPAGAEAASDFLPAGYVWFLYVLGKLQVCISPVISFLQLAFFVSGSYVLTKINHNRKQFPVLLAICLLNWMVLKFVITALSEMQFFFLTSLSLFFFYRWEKSGKIPDALCCIVFTILAVYTRTAGLSLVVAALLYFLITRFRNIRSGPLFYKLAPVLFLLAGAVFIFLSDSMHVNDYVQFLSSHFENGVMVTLLRNGWLHMIDFGSVFLNLPSAKVPFLATQVVDALFFITGLLFLSLIIYFLVTRKSSMNLFLRLYVGVYLLMIFNWPYYEPRFFLPVFPLIVLLILPGLNFLHRILSRIMKLYIVWYGLAGIAAVGYYTYTSLNRQELARRQDAGIWRNEYETYFYGKPVNDSATQVKQPVVELIKKYN